MNNRKISLLLIGLGICIIIVGTFMSIRKNSIGNTPDNSTENRVDDNEPSEVEIKEENKKNEEDCLNDYKTQNLKKITISDNEVLVKVDFLKSIKKVEAEKSIRYQSGEGKITLELTIHEEDIDEYSKEVYKKLSEKNESIYNSIRNRDFKTNSGVNSNMISLIEKDGDKNYVMSTYNIFYPINETKFLQIEVVYKDGILEDGFLETIANSIEIGNK